MVDFEQVFLPGSHMQLPSIDRSGQPNQQKHKVLLRDRTEAIDTWSTTSCHDPNASVQGRVIRRH